MTISSTIPLAVLLLTTAHVATAQPVARPGDPARSVTLSLAEYNRLIDLANRPPQGAAAAPVAAVVAGADLRIRVDADTARGVFNLTGDVLRAGISRVSLMSGATLVDATADGRPVPLIVDGNAHAALIAGPGPFAVRLEWASPLTFAPGRASFVVPVPQAGAARATIDVPGEQADIRLSAGLITRRSAAAGRTIVEATLDPGSSTEVWWSMRDSAPAAAAHEVRTLADVMTLITLGDSDVRMVALIDITVVRGELRAIGLQLPPGYELTGISGSSLESSEPRDAGLMLTVGDPAARSHQFLVSLERAHDGGSFAIDTAFVSVADVQRERGEVAVEGVATLELTAAERDDMHRMDVRELNQALQSLARLPILSAFRYQRSAGPPRGLALQVRRFADAGVLAAVANHGVATTLVTGEGRALTEISLQVQNRSQPFLKVTLPPGATMVSVEVAGEAAKPVLGSDGVRVPLLRPRFRPNGTYQVSFVYLHAGTPLTRKGDVQMVLPRMDMPVGLVQWEVFVPDQYKVRTIDGNALDVSTSGYDFATGFESKEEVTLRGTLADAVKVFAEGSSKDVPKTEGNVAPSQNVINLQRRVAGVLPVRVDVPRAGTSHRFVKPLVVDQETVVKLRYKRR